MAILKQHDTFFSMLTPRETINLAAFLQLNIVKKDRDMLVDKIFNSLGLRSVENRRIGEFDTIDGLFGRLSGGERRRLSLGKLCNELYFVMNSLV